MAGNADKFFSTDLDKILKEKGVQTAVIAGAAANGAVLYTAFGASMRGYTVVVAEDTISVAPGLEFAMGFTKWQLLKQPGFANADNKPLEKQRVTLSRSDLIGFGVQPTGTAPTGASAATAAPAEPALSAVSLDAKTAAVLSLDLIEPTCTQRPLCVASLASVADLLKRAREAKALVVHTTTTAAGVTIRPEVAPAQAEPTVAANADKFFGTSLDQLLKDRKIENLVLVGSAAHGAILYTAFQANLRGYTVVVPVDGISVGSGDEFGLSGTRWQLLNQPGFTNVDNLPLTKQRVTLGRAAFVTFR